MLSEALCISEGVLLEEDDKEEDSELGSKSYSYPAVGDWFGSSLSSAGSRRGIEVEEVMVECAFKN